MSGLREDRLDEARALIGAGRFDEAEAIYAAVLDTAPDHVEALHVLGLGALRAGRTTLAAERLSRAVQLEPGTAALRYPLGRVHELLGALRQAVEQYDAACRLDPGHSVARLHLASALERLGDRAGATLQYARALQEAQAKGRWTDARTTPADLVALVEHASLSVRAANREMYARLVEPLRKAYGRGALARVERCIRMVLGEEPRVLQEPRQQPTFLYFPDLPTSAYLPRDLFPWIRDLEERTDAIGAELAERLRGEGGAERVFTSDELEKANLRGDGSPPTWTGHYFYRYGERRADNCDTCPQTAAALDKVDLCHVAGHAPEVLFSVFTPGTHLLPHRGVTNTRAVAHLPLIVPSDCALVVGGEVHEWRRGEVVVFDDTYEHEAWNRSRQTRVVLIMDVWNPHLTEVERSAVTRLVTAVSDVRRAIEAL